VISVISAVKNQIEAKVRDGEDTIASTRDARAPQNSAETRHGEQALNATAERLCIATFASQNRRA